MFGNAQIPENAWSVPAQRMLTYIPAPNNADGFATSTYNQTVQDDKAGARVDANSRWGMLSAYYFIDEFTLDNPYPAAQSGASVPGFDALTTGGAQLLALSADQDDQLDNGERGALSYLRDFTNLGQPVGGRGVSLVSQGFANADGTPSIVALDPEGAERGEPEFQRLFDRRRGKSVDPGQQYLPGVRQFFKGAGQPHNEDGRGVPR